MARLLDLAEHHAERLPDGRGAGRHARRRAQPPRARVSGTKQQQQPAAHDGGTLEAACTSMQALAIALATLSLHTRSRRAHASPVPLQVLFPGRARRRRTGRHPPRAGLLAAARGRLRRRQLAACSRLRRHAERERSGRADTHAAGAAGEIHAVRHRGRRVVACARPGCRAAVRFEAQVLSVTETQYTGEDVVLITPDSDTLSILQVRCLVVLMACMAVPHQALMTRRCATTHAGGGAGPGPAAAS